MKFFISNDKIQIFKLVVKTIARLMVYATFMAKPKFGIMCGSGMHCNMSPMLKATTHSLIVIQRCNYPETLITWWFDQARLQLHNIIRQLTQTFGSGWRRFTSLGAGHNRSPLRVPATREMGTRLELRSRPNGKSIYAFGSLHGIENKKSKRQHNWKTSISWLQKNKSRPSINSTTLWGYDRRRSG